MPAVLYIVICFLAGIAIKKVSGINTRLLFAGIAGPETAKEKLPPAWTFDIPFSLITGTTLVTTMHYLFSYAAHFAVKGTGINPLLISNIIIFIAFIVLFAIFLRCAYIRQSGLKNALLSARAGSIDYLSDSGKFYALTVWGSALFVIYFIFYTFIVKGQFLHSGFTVFSDFAPHTAVISSFAYGDNFPTEYPHFAGDGIQYHFFFFYLCANLLYLGLRFDFAMNIPSIIGILSFTILLGSLGVLITKRKAVFLLSPFMLFFRSSYAVFDYLKELFSKPEAGFASVLRDVFMTSKFIGTTAHDDWGLWAMNVFANQRHFLWGVSMLLVVLFIMYPSIKDMTSAPVWKVKNARKLIPVLALTAVFPYWHGSVLISMLCMLFIMAFFAKEKLAYLAVAVAGVLFSLLSSGFFSGGASNVVNPQFLWGFLADDKSLPGVAYYLFKVTGIALIFIIVIPFTRLSRDKMVFFAASSSLIVFAFTVSLTSDVTVNHKYVILAVGLLNILIAGLYLAMWSKIHSIRRSAPAAALISGILAIFIGFSLFATGFVEFIGYHNKNVSSVSIDLQAPLIRWLKENTDPEDVFLTAPYHMNTFFFSGRKLFYGWPYYTMTAGHDTQSRLEEVSDLFTGCGGNVELFRTKAEKYHLKYAIIDDELLNDEGYVVDVDFFEQYCTEAARFPEDDNMRIYKLYD